jgi:threonyl-tRNA synthetase
MSTDHEGDILVCTPEQIKGEIDDLFKFLDKVYGLFGFEYKLELSTRPDSYLGDIETWNTAEAVSTSTSVHVSCPKPLTRFYRVLKRL